MLSDYQTTEDSEASSPVKVAEPNPNQIYEALVASGGNFQVAAEMLARVINKPASEVSTTEANALQLYVAQDQEILQTLNSIYQLSMLTDLLKAIRLVSQEVSRRATDAPVADLLKAYPALINQALALMNPRGTSGALEGTGNVIINNNNNNTQLNNIKAVLDVLPDGIREAVVRMATGASDAETASLIEGQIRDATDLQDAP